MKFLALLSLILLSYLTTSNLSAKDKFSAAIQVDEMIITQYEIDQRAKFFKLRIKDKGELDSLMSKEEYDKFCKENPN